MTGVRQAPDRDEAARGTGELSARPARKRGCVRDALAAVAWSLVALSAIAVYILVSFGTEYLVVDVCTIFGIAPADIDINWLQAAMQLAMFAVAFAWWRYLYARSFGCRWRGSRTFDPTPAAVAKRIALVVVLGMALQVVVGIACDFVLSFFPKVASDYETLMEEADMGSTALLPVLTTVIGAPFSEELLLRGVVMEFALRAFNPQCRPLWRCRRVRPEDGTIVRRADADRLGLIAGVVLQALVFGILHMNIVQGCYAFAVALVFGWLFWATGSLRYTILLHFAFNAGSYLMGLLWFINTSADALVTLAVALVVMFWAMGEIRAATRP